MGIGQHTKSDVDGIIGVHALAEFLRGKVPRVTPKVWGDDLIRVAAHVHFHLRFGHTIGV